MNSWTEKSSTFHLKGTRGKSLLWGFRIHIVVQPDLLQSGQNRLYYLAGRFYAPQWKNSIKIYSIILKHVLLHTAKVLIEVMIYNFFFLFSGQPHKLIYSIEAGNEASDLFHIDADTGMMSTVGKLDFESKRHHQLRVRATDMLNGGHRYVKHLVENSTTRWQLHEVLLFFFLFFWPQEAPSIKDVNRV